MLREACARHRRRRRRETRLTGLSFACPVTLGGKLFTRRSRLHNWLVSGGLCPFRSQSPQRLPTDSSQMLVRPIPPPPQWLLEFTLGEWRAVHWLTRAESDSGLSPASPRRGAGAGV